MLKIIDVINKKIYIFITENFSKIKEINKRYHVPKVKMSKPVKFALLMLRLYLLFLVGLLAYKFVTMII
ncbi:MAG: hypothetical protein PHV30_08325 [Candidatus Margulisbacteria bacterium]|nr:hypothetical protein [Candidatus Margulisiibacteriota bacterium]